MRDNGLCKCSAGFRSGSLSSPQVANSFIQNFLFTVNRQRRIGGVEQCENAGKPRPPALHLHFVTVSFFFFFNISADLVREQKTSIVWSFPKILELSYRLKNQSTTFGFLIAMNLTKFFVRLEAVFFKFKVTEKTFLWFRVNFARR